MLDIPKSQDQLHQVDNAIMTGIHDVFPPDKDDKEDAISLKKFWKSNPHGQLLRMCWDLNLMETQESIPCGSLRTAIQIFQKNWKSGLGKESTEKRLSPLNNFEPILQNWDMRSLLPHLKNDYYPRATIFWERIQIIYSYNETNLYCRLSVIVANYYNCQQKIQPHLRR